MIRHRDNVHSETIAVSPTCWQQHELLHGELVAGVTASVDDVEGGNGHDDGLVAGQVSDVSVQRDALHTYISRTLAYGKTTLIINIGVSSNNNYQHEQLSNLGPSILLLLK